MRIAKFLFCFTMVAAGLHSQDAPAPAKAKIQLGGALDTEAAWDANSPAGDLAQSLGFLSRTNQVRLTEATLSLDADFGHAGFHLDGGYGDFYKVAMEKDSWKGPNRYVSEAYAFWKPNTSLRIDAGKFFTSVGVEAPRSYDNFNITRSLLFGYGQPLYHVGVKASEALGSGYTVGAQLLSGCDTVTDVHGHQTVALTGAWIGKTWGWSEIYLDGNEKYEGSGRRHLSDTVFNFTPSQAVSGYAEILAAVEKRVAPGYDHWYGWATAWKLSPVERWSFSPRLDWYRDEDGATTGLAQSLTEFTVTGEYRPRKFLIARVEYRYDHSNQQFYSRAEGLRPSHQQQTVLFGLTLLFQRQL